MLLLLSLPAELMPAELLPGELLLLPFVTTTEFLWVDALDEVLPSLLSLLPLLLLAVVLLVTAAELMPAVLLPTEHVPTTVDRLLSVGFVALAVLELLRCWSVEKEPRRARDEVLWGARVRGHVGALPTSPSPSPGRPLDEPPAPTSSFPRSSYLVRSSVCP